MSITYSKSLQSQRYEDPIAAGAFAPQVQKDPIVALQPFKVKMVRGE